MPRIAMLGRFQPVHLGHENAIRRMQQYGDAYVGIYVAPLSAYNPYRPEDVETMLHNAVPGINVFYFHPTLNPTKFIAQLEADAGTKTVYTRSWRSVLLMGILGFEIIYEERDKFRSSQIRESLISGTDDWKSLVHEPNIEIITRAGFQGGGRSLRGRLLNSLYKHGFM